MKADSISDMFPKKTMSVGEACAALERLRASTGSVPRHHPAPGRFIDELHEALIPLATSEMQGLYRLDNAIDVPMGYLHDRVREVLANVDKLLAERQSPR